MVLTILLAKYIHLLTRRRLRLPADDNRNEARGDCNNNDNNGTNEVKTDNDVAEEDEEDSDDSDEDVEIDNVFVPEINSTRNGLFLNKIAHSSLGRDFAILVVRTLK